MARALEANMNPVGKAVGEVIRFYRGRHDMTQEHLARKAGIAPTSVVRLENGEIERPRISTLTKIADALEVEPQELTSFVTRNPASIPEPVEAGDVGPFTAVYQRDGEWWIGFVEELPGANAQGESLEEARESLREAVSLVLEANREITRTEFEGGDVVREPLSV
jgi:transcriptional regulator with XRE-family HTH domain